jgi:predicted transcriptional regulator
MEVHFTPDLEKKLNDLAAQSGRSTDELVQDAVAGMVDELAETREMLDRRYDDIKSGNVKLIPGEEAFARLRERIDTRRRNGSE